MKLCKMELLGMFCHRLPERTFKIGKRYFPVCARCTGFYIGTFLIYTVLYLIYIDYTMSIGLMGCLMLFPAIIDGTTQFFGFRESNNVLRLLTGLVGGVGLGVLFKFIKFIIIGGVLVV